ncbi:hypothetical protein HBI56_097400 [Parastagonospora nodorum]|uniref:Uncharacterized protein n=2 Tax=Phaeosphaeria nodorum (strain SN15 / ATCC MYA-4574 / FGSC 10173) TaxID=321614 RepID=A0A7U2I4D2_PHANO|nr:hypothetical protein SNOG_06306 [Parastagonospora nodorum SN15]KAH3918918.1 hypothetical protein HBH56_026390 [Parastagonospora nodorum]EAT86137.1 hypothetical protein SNOG_06306 [Parastagonospora nodorum SN15]KAH3934456.1 hypothetical protein HBH54_055650 [Parastagonospora nodorum]KAH3949898.1 hypothetical protein HBH53_083340 [Parastagonospora nodorum]KAH3985296.1 hypothetical protein HBH52_054460 [Parastagonospora nodorum]
MLRRSLTTTSFAFRRSFTTTARLRATNDKPPAKKPTSRQPPRPRDEHQSKENTRNGQEESVLDRMKAEFDPKSPHSTLGFANPKLSSEQRSRNLFLVTLATFFAFVTEPLMISAEQDEWFPSREAFLADLITSTVIQSRKEQDKESRIAGL